jgi:anti-sigma B factor antagonist
MAPFKLKLIQAGAGGVPVLSVTGELDLYTAPEFEQRLREALELEPGGLVVDLLGSTLLDSTACGALLAAAQRLRARQARLVIVNRDPEIARILDVMGLEEFLDVVPCGEDAQALGAAA